MADIQIQAFKASIRPSRRLRFRHWLQRRRLTPQQRELADAVSAKVERAFLLGRQDDDVT